MPNIVGADALQKMGRKIEDADGVVEAGRGNQRQPETVTIELNSPIPRA
jgi:hypothetical protein